MVLFQMSDELIHEKQYTGSIAQFAESVFGYFRVGAKVQESGAEPKKKKKWPGQFHLALRKPPIADRKYQTNRC